MTDAPLPASQPEHSEPAAQERTDQQVHLQVTVPSGARVKVILDARTPDGHPLPSKTVVLTNPARSNALLPVKRIWQKLAAADRSTVTTLLISAAVVVYLAVRLIGLEQFPIYFFTDEAVQTMSASDLLRDGLRSPSGEFLPTYFVNGQQYNLSTSVYLQALPLLIFRRSVFLTRLVPVLVGLLAVLSITLIAGRFFGSPFPWLAPLLLSVTPAWFLHSRTAFETVLATIFFACFLAAYLLYRLENPRWLYAAVVFAALTFYTYSPGQLVIALTALLLLLVDARYHWQQRRWIGRALWLVLLLAIPYARYQHNHPGETLRHLQLLRSYWTLNAPLTEKLARFFEEYARGLNPLYWILPEQDLTRHMLKGYGNLWRPSLPFLALGLGIAVVRFRSPTYRTLLIALLAAPAGAALVGLGITRALFMVVPAVLLTTLGLSETMQAVGGFFSRRTPKQAAWANPALAGLVFLGLSAGSFMMLDDALTHGPLWYQDYTMTGMQYGARQLFPAVKDYLKAHPGTHLIVSPDWANGTDVVSRFFSGDSPGYELGSIRGYMIEKKPLDSSIAFVLMPEEWDAVKKSGKFTGYQVDQVLPYPNGEPGFYFIRLRYVDAIDQIFAEEKANRLAMRTGKATLPDGSPIRVSYSNNDMGQLQDLFDGNVSSIFRTEAANPLRIGIDFPQPRTLTSVVVRVGGVPTRVIVRVTLPDEPEVLVRSVTLEEQPEPRDAVLDLGGSYETRHVEIEILNTQDGEPAHVHAWEITFR